MGQVHLTDDGELIEAMDVSPDEFEGIEPEKKKKTVAAGERVLGGVGVGVGLGVVVLVVIALVWGVQQIQYQATIHEWKVPELPNLPSAGLVSSPSDVIGLAGEILLSLQPCIGVLLILPVALFIVRAVISVFKTD